MNNTTELKPRDPQMDKPAFIINGVTYVVTELPMRAMLPIMKSKLEDCIHMMVAQSLKDQHGQPVGDGALDLPFSQYKKIMDAVNRAHGLDSDEEKGDNEKND